MLKGKFNLLYIIYIALFIDQRIMKLTRVLFIRICAVHATERSFFPLDICVAMALINLAAAMIAFSDVVLDA